MGTNHFFHFERDEETNGRRVEKKIMILAITSLGIRYMTLVQICFCISSSLFNLLLFEVNMMDRRCEVKLYKS